MREGFVDCLIVYPWERYKKCDIKRAVDPLEPRRAELLSGRSPGKLSGLTALAHRSWVG